MKPYATPEIKRFGTVSELTGFFNYEPYIDPLTGKRLRVGGCSDYRFSITGHTQGVPGEPATLFCESQDIVLEGTLYTGYFRWQ